MFKKINILLLSLVVAVGFCGSVKTLTAAQGKKLDAIKLSFANATRADALTTILDNLRSSRNSTGEFWQSIKATNDALQALDTGANNLASVLQNKFSTVFSASANTYNITDTNLKLAVLSLVNDLSTNKLKTQFRLEETASVSSVASKAAAKAGKR